jgi:hypothetical protein
MVFVRVPRKSRIVLLPASHLILSRIGQAEVLPESRLVRIGVFAENSQIAGAKRGSGPADLPWKVCVLLVMALIGW